MVCFQEHTCSLDSSGAAAFCGRSSHCVSYSRLFQCTYRGPDYCRSGCSWRGHCSMGRRCSDWRPSERLALCRSLYQLSQELLCGIMKADGLRYHKHTPSAECKDAPSSGAWMMLVRED